MKKIGGIETSFSTDDPDVVGFEPKTWVKADPTFLFPKILNYLKFVLYSVTLKKYSVLNEKGKALQPELKLIQNRVNFYSKLLNY